MHVDDQSYRAIHVEPPGSMSRFVLTAFLFLSVVAPAFYVAVVSAQGSTPEAQDRLCEEKKQGLARLEQEAPGLRTQITNLENYLATLRTPLPTSEDIDNKIAEAQRGLQALAGSTGSAASDLVRVNQRRYYEVELSFWQSIKRGATPLARGVALDKILGERVAVEKQLASLRQRQTYVASQISILRDAIASLKCPLSRPLSPPIAQAADFSGTWIGRQYPRANMGEHFTRYYVDVKLVLTKKGNSWTGVYQIAEDTREASDRPATMNGRSVTIEPDTINKGFNVVEEGGNLKPVKFDAITLSYESRYISAAPISLTKVGP
jgi:hypothetical protein